MIVFPGQDIVFRRVSNFNKRHDEVLTAVAVILGVLTLCGTVVFFGLLECRQKRKIDYLVTIDSVKYRLQSNENKIREVKAIYCTDQNGNKWIFPDMIPTVRTVEFEQGKRYIITTQGPSPRRITSAETVTADKWLETNQKKE